MRNIFFKRWLPAVILLCGYNFTQAQAVKEVEYFFDTDPGIGNGIIINITNLSLNIDSTFTFDVSSLSNGLHMLYVRTEDTSNNWSLNYSTSFIKSNGTGGPLSIVKLEYFVDTDPGFGNATNIPINTANVVDSTFEFLVSDNGANTRYLTIRAMDSRDQWSLLYSDTINMCQLYKSRPNFSWIRYADLFSFIDSSTINPAHTLLWNFDQLGSSTISNPQFTFPDGNHSVTLTSGTGCREDSITLPLFVGLEKYHPDTAFNGADMIMSFYGGGLDTNLIVTLNNHAGTIINPYFRGSYDQKSFKGLFDLHTAPAGTYDIRLEYSGGYDTTITNGLRVIDIPDSSYEPDISIDIADPHKARPESIVFPIMTISNNSPIVGKSIPVWMTADSTVIWDFLKPLNFVAPPAAIPYIDSIPLIVGIDSITVDGRMFRGQLRHFTIPYLGPGESMVIPLRQSAPIHEGELSILYYWNNKTMFGSPLKVAWGDCFDGIVDFALTAAGVVVPPIALINCMSSLFVNFSYDMVALAIAANEGRANYMHFMQLIAGSLIGCIPGAQVAKLVKASALIVKAIQAIWDGANTYSSYAGASLGIQNGCIEVNNNPFGPRYYGKNVVAADPNDISGPQGYGLNQYINDKKMLGYQVYFENIPAATANAQRVYITDTLDKTKMDLSTFALSGFNLADTFIAIPPYRKEYTTTLDLRPSQNLLLRFNAKLDSVQGVLHYSLLSLDPVTMDTLPLSDLRGFLPPDTNGITGKASVSYVVNQKTGLLHNDVINNRASIVFDNNAPISTNTWFNTIDKIAPTGGVVGGTIINDTTVRLNMNGSDDGAGISRYHLYGSLGDNPFQFLGNFPGDTVRFTGIEDSTYHFYAIPYDSVDNFSPKAPVAEYTITLSNPLPVTLLSFHALKQQKDVLCSWQTTSEVNFNYYVVERSLDGSSFETAGIVQAQSGNGVKNYQFTDVNAIGRFNANNRLFYRLRMVDIDNTSHYSRIARIDFDKKYTVAVYPNPAKDEIFIDGIQHYRFVQITDIIGRAVLSEKIIPGMQTINISRLNVGAYILKLSGDDDVQSIKFIKQ